MSTKVAVHLKPYTEEKMPEKIFHFRSDTAGCEAITI